MENNCKSNCFVIFESSDIGQKFDSTITKRTHD